MISLKKLNLDVDKLNNCLLENAKHFFNNEDINLKIEPKGTSFLYTITNNKNEYKFSLYPKSDGSSTLTTNGSPDTQSVTDALIQKISIDYSISEKKNYNFSVQNIKDDEFDYLKDFLQTEGKAIIIESKDEFSYCLYKFQGPHKDSLTVKRYKNGNTQFQGKPIYLYLKLCEYLCDICSAEDIIKAQQQIYEIELNQTAIEVEYNSRLTRSSAFLGDTIKDIILPSFSMINVEVDLTDYSMFIFPVLRGLEGYIRLIFNKYGIKNDTKKNPLGDFFAPNMKKYELKTEFRTIINDSSVSVALGQLYTKYHDERNSIFHVDAGIETARIIETREEANSIFNEVIDLIESTYIDMNP